MVSKSPYVVPAPKDNLAHVQEKAPNNTMGGKQFSKTMFAPMNPFSGAVGKTPQSTDPKRIIPWDQANCDFVYGALHDNLFGCLMSRKVIKAAVDHYLTPNSRVLAIAYPIYMIIAILMIVLSIILTAVAIILIWPEKRKYWTTQDYWWLIYAPTPIYCLLLIGTICFMRSRDDSKIRTRMDDIDKACKDINLKKLYNSGFTLETGDYGAWIEVHVDRAIGILVTITSS